MKQWESIGLWVALGIFGLVAFLAYGSIDLATDTLGWVEHTHQVLHQIEDVSGAYSRAAGARRAYVVAGDDSQLSDEAALDARLTASLASLRSLVADNPNELHRVDALGDLLRQRILDLETSVASRRLRGTGVESTEGLALASSIRAVREQMQAEENRLLAERYSRTNRDVSRAKLPIVAGTCVSIAILLFAFGRLRKEIDRRRRSEHAIRDAGTFLDSIVENIPDMIFVKEAGELRFERINAAGEKLLGIGRGDLLGKNDYDFFPRDQADSFQERDRETLAGRVVVDIPEEPINTKEGSRWLHTKKVPIVDEQGRPTFLLGISEDITEPKRAAEALKAAKAAADAANLELESFSYSVAHDLRAPLRAIDGFGEALQEDCADKLDAIGRGHLRRVRESAKQMAELIDGLLGLSRVTRGDLARKRVDLTRIAQHSSAQLREADPQRKVELVVQDGLVGDGDAHLLTAALDNLLANAWKFTAKSASPRIEVGKLLQDGHDVFFVQDNGVGFDKAYAHKLFGAFQRLHSATEFEGHGIGLATVQRIIRRHGGRIWAEGDVGRGATFYFTL